jgi:hypothetical protein
MEPDDLLQLIALGPLAGGEPRMGEYTGTKALMLAVLDNGIRSYLGPAGRIRTEAEYWVNGGDRRSPFSFTVVCETLGLEPDAVRGALRRGRPQSGVVLERIRPKARRARDRAVS